MQYGTLGSFGRVSRLTLGGGGIGQGWGETSRDEASQTIKLAVDRGVDLLDTAPLYRNCEAIVGDVFGGRLPRGLRITTKCSLGSPPAHEVADRLNRSLESSLKTMRLDRVDIFFLHTNICPDDYVYAIKPEQQDTFATKWSIYAEQFIPAVEALKASGKIRMWGITGSGLPRTIVKALRHAPKPAVVQAVANLLDSAGGLRRYAEPAEPRTVIAAAKDQGVGVLGIRAVQAGALTNAIDRSTSPNHPETRDFARAAPYRELCGKWGQDPAVVAHRYALGIDGVDTLILGVKNRDELRQCLDAEAAGPLDAEQTAAIDRLGLRTS
ncbi:MAG: aldo/keto reductase [Alphaproteobacteria bacterium]|nr:aldo/keto reductase [Alphaproteobacteria bacterium]